MSELTGLEKTTTNLRKYLCGREILKANDQINKIMHALTTTFVNPFNENLDNDRLHNLVSGSTVIDDIAQNLLSVS